MTNIEQWMILWSLEGIIITNGLRLLFTLLFLVQNGKQFWNYSVHKSRKKNSQMKITPLCQRKAANTEFLREEVLIGSQQLWTGFVLCIFLKRFSSFAITKCYQFHMIKMTSTNGLTKAYFKSKNILFRNKNMLSARLNVCDLATKQFCTWDVRIQWFCKLCRHLCCAEFWCHDVHINSHSAYE